ncbi:MAG TPA: hypothetical protein PKC19_03370, partial [Roseiflexaceae bacterium]|nr:hypothetical protein [Roseiflexaceae bacterium]
TTTSDRPYTMLNTPNTQRPIVDDPAGYDAIVVWHSQPPDPAIVRDLYARNPRIPVAGYSIFLTDPAADPARRAFPQSISPDRPMQLVFGDHLELLGVDLDPIVVPADYQPTWLDSYLSSSPELFAGRSTEVHVTLYWRKLNQLAQPYNLSARLIPLAEPGPVLTARYAGTEDLLPTTLWPPGQLVRDEFTIRIPPDAPQRRYGLWVGVNQGFDTLVPQVADQRSDAGNRVLVGILDLQPAGAPIPVPDDQPPAIVLDMPLGDGIVLHGYTSRSDDDGLTIETWWQRESGTSDAALVLTLGQAGTMARATVDVAAPIAWQPGRRYYAVTHFPALLPNSRYTLGIERIDEQGAASAASLTPLDWCAADQLPVILSQHGLPGDALRDNPRIASGTPLQLQFELAAQREVAIRIDWTGRAEAEQIVLQVDAVHQSWQVGARRKPLATIEAKRGQRGSVVVRVPRNLTRVGINQVEISIPAQSPAGWRIPAAQILPPLAPLLATNPTRYQGWVELDVASAILIADLQRISPTLDALPVATLAEVGATLQQADACYDAPTYTQLMAAVQQAFGRTNWQRIATGDLVAAQALATEPAAQAAIRDALLQRIAVAEVAEFTDRQGQRIRLLGYRTASVDGESGTATRIEFFFEPLSPIRQDLTIWLHGYPNPGTMLPADRQAVGFANFDHQPPLPTSHWQEGRIYTSTFIVPAVPDAYQFRFGFYRAQPFEVFSSSNEPVIDTHRIPTNNTQ